MGELECNRKTTGIWRNFAALQARASANVWQSRHSRAPHRGMSALALPGIARPRRLIRPR
jgi:hypothetical protein